MGLPQPPDFLFLKAYPTPGVGSSFFFAKMRERMNLKVFRAVLPLGCVFLNIGAKTAWGCYNPEFRELG